jgi:hypothetical protein
VAKPKKNLRTSVCEALRRLLPDPVREEASGEGTTLVAGDPGRISVCLTDEGLAVSVFGVRWDGPHTPVPDHRPLAEVAWADFRGNEAEAVVAAYLLVQAATLVRRAAFRRCRYCGENTPPEWWHGEDACQGCAERHLVVVH